MDFEVEGVRQALQGAILRVMRSGYSDTLLSTVPMALMSGFSRMLSASVPVVRPQKQSPAPMWPLVRIP